MGIKKEVLYKNLIKLHRNICIKLLINKYFYIIKLETFINLSNKKINGNQFVMLDDIIENSHKLIKVKVKLLKISKFTDPKQLIV